MTSRTIATACPPDLRTELLDARLVAKVAGITPVFLTLGPEKQKAFARMVLGTGGILDVVGTADAEMIVTEYDGLKIRTSDLPGLYLSDDSDALAGHPDHGKQNLGG